MKPDDSIRRQELLSSAARLFRDVGYPRATVRDIAKAVGIQSGSIFYYFKTKEDILVDVMEAAMQTFVGAAQRALREASTPETKLRELFVGHLKALHGSSDETAVVLSEWRNLSPKSRRKIVKLRRPGRQHVGRSAARCLRCRTRPRRPAIAAPRHARVAELVAPVVCAQGRAVDRGTRRPIPRI
ncbi:MAG: TetR/AcrR family transcriptional regulator, partial [Betaproteobacteria bacterium]|nr:TetR/AcrR family transcriptional regulator [Betaproteobacteria bacterium]